MRTFADSVLSKLLTSSEVEEMLISDGLDPSNPKDLIKCLTTLMNARTLDRACTISFLDYADERFGLDCPEYVIDHLGKQIVSVVNHYLQMDWQLAITGTASDNVAHLRMMDYE